MGSYHSCVVRLEVLQETEKDELVQAKNRELARLQEQLRQQVIFNFITLSIKDITDCEHWFIDYVTVYRSSPARGRLVI